MRSKIETFKEIRETLVVIAALFYNAGGEDYLQEIIMIDEIIEMIDDELDIMESWRNMYETTNK